MALRNRTLDMESQQLAERPIRIQHPDSQVVDTRITDQWGVEWSPMEIARDFFQNFYDENPIDTRLGGILK